MAEMIIDKKHVVPVSNTPSQHFDDLVGQPEDNVALKASLDGKVDKTNHPISLYGTDNQGNQTIYDASSILGEDSCPEGYTEVEYITSTVDSLVAINIIQGDNLTVTPNRETGWKALFDQVSSDLGAPAIRIRAVAFDDGTPYIRYHIYGIDSQGNEVLYHEIPSTSDWYTYWSITVEGAVYDDEFEFVRDWGGQYINTGIQIKDYPYGAGFLDNLSGRTHYESIQVNPTIYSTDYRVFHNILSLMTANYETKITKCKVIAIDHTTFELWPDEEEYDSAVEPYRTYGDTSTLRTMTGISLQSGNTGQSNEYPTAGDTFYFYSTPPMGTAAEIITAVKGNSTYDELGTSSFGSIIFFGSNDPSGQGGIGLSTSVGDGVGYKHYNLHNRRIDTPYCVGLWNEITIRPSEFICNNNSEAVNISNVRTGGDCYFYLFGASVNGGTADRFSACSIKRFVLKNNGNKVFSGIPCVEDSSGIAGMYDAVSNQFFKSAKTGIEFIAGPVVTGKKITLGLDERNTLVGIGMDGSTASYTGGRHIVLESAFENDEYEQLEYIESIDQLSAINTGTTYESKSWRGFEVTYCQTQSATDSAYWQVVMGDRKCADLTQTGYRSVFDFYQGKARYLYTNVNSSLSVASNLFAEDLNTWHTFTMNYTQPTYSSGKYQGSKIFLDGKELVTLNPMQGYQAHTGNMYIFGAQDTWSGGPASFQNGFIGRIARFRYYYNQSNEGNISSNRVVLADLVPARRKSDGAIGFYDTINGGFHQNVGNGSLVAGPKKIGTVALDRDLDSYLENQSKDIDSSYSMIVSAHTKYATDTVSDLSKSNNIVFGINAFSKGTNNTVVGCASGATADKNDNVVIGNQAFSYADKNVVIGDIARGNAGYSVVVGCEASTLTGGSYSVMVGYQAMTNSQNSVAIGYKAKCYGAGSIRIGGNPNDPVGIEYGVRANTVAIGVNLTNLQYSNNSTFIGTGSGSDASTSLDDMIAIGRNAKVCGNYAISINSGTGNAVGGGSIGMGYGVKAGGGNMVVIGREAGQNTYNTVTTNDYSVCVGYRAISTGESSVSIGNDAEASIQAVAIGPNTTASGYNVAIGRNASATNNNEIAIGSGATSGGSGSIAIGESTLSSNRSISIGNGARSTAAASTAIGPNASAEGHSSIAIGNETHAVWDSSFAIGHGAEAGNGYYSLAIGNQAKAYGQYATQISEGTNNYPNTLQFRTYQLVDSDGYIPSGRLSGGAQDGYVLSYNGATGRMKWVEQSGGGGGYELPIASASTLGGIKVGSGLQINSETGVLSVTGGGSGGGDGVWGQITGNIEDQTDLKAELDTRVQQLEEIPTASRDYNERVIQFTGISDLLYEHGFFYECQYRKISNIDSSTSDDTRFGVTFDVPRFEKYLKVYEDYEVQDNDSFVFEMRDDGEWYISVNGDELTDISPNNLPYMGVNVELYGTTELESGDEIYADYMSAENPDSQSGYIWTQINIQQNHNVIDNITSTSTTDALSANQGKLLNDKIETLESIGQFLAIWDCNKNGYNARYLDDGYQYQRGNYFIIGAVEEWNLDPEEGPVTVSFDTNNQVAISHGYTTYADEMKTYNRYKPTTDATFKFTWDVSSQKWYDETKHTYINAGSLLSTIGFCPSYGGGAGEVQAADLVEGDYFEVLYTHTHNYFPIGDTYYEDPNAGCVRTYEDVQVSDMIFYDGANWVLLANHSKQTAVDHDLDPNSKNPVENATIYNALQQKVSTTRQTNRLYGTDAYSSQTTYELGDGLAFEEGKLVILGKQDTLVSGENIKTINGESILGSGNIEIQGGGGEGMGTLNISNVFHRYHSVTKEDDVRDERDDKYKGGYKEILFTTNADVDYLKANKEDIYVTYSRRNAFHNLRKYRVLNDHRVKSDVKLYCWRYKTYQYWDSTFNTMRYNDWDWDNYASDLNYEYFYTLSDYSDDVETMYGDNPAMFISDLRRQGAQKDDDNYSMGNWGTCFNELYNYDTVRNYYDDYSEVIENGRLERCAKYDIDELVIDTQDLKYDGDEDTDFIIKMVGQSFTKNGLKYYFWSHEWWNEGSIYACLDDNDNPIPNYVPEDKSKIVYFCEFADLESEGYELVEKRPDLVWWKFNENRTTDNIRRFIEHCRDITTNCSNNSETFDSWTSNESVADFSCNDQWSFLERIDNKDGDYTLIYDASAGGWYFNYDGNLYYPNDLGDNSFELLDGEFSYRVNTDAGYSSVEDGAVLNIYFENRYDKAHRVYFWDYPIQPVRLSQCKIVMTSMPPFQPEDPETGEYPTDKYEDYMFHAYTFDEIDASEDLTYMLQCQKEIIFVYPYDTHHLWMRTFGFTKMVYQHERTDVQQYQWHWEDDNPTWDYDPETSEKIPVDYTMYAEPWDRHNLRRGMFLGGQRNLGNSDIAEDTRNLGDFDNRMGPIQGSKEEPRWTMGLQALYFLPVALNINKANEMFYNTDGKSTPFYFKLCITGMGNQKILAGQ